MRFHVDAWDPGYGASFARDSDADAPSSRSSAQVEVDVELPAATWRPLDPPADVAPPAVVLLVDGVRRIDARIWVGDDDAVAPGLAASYAAGVVRCDLRRGVAEVVAARIARGVFSGSPHLVDVDVGDSRSASRYTAHQLGRVEPQFLDAAVQGQLRSLEVAVSRQARGEVAGPAAGGGTATDDDLLLVDGPLHDRRDLPRALGYIKTHRDEYLPPGLAGLIARLGPGQRCPVFGMGTRWRRYSWYLRLPGPPGAPWAGIVRVECAAELAPAAAVALADLSAVAIPRFASTAYKDPRAPQNLVPIAGLERRLRAMLGDARLLHRGLTLTARRPVQVPVP
jgi:hypothetical protein